MKICQTALVTSAFMWSFAQPGFAQLTPVTPSSSKVVLPESTEIKLTLEKSLKSGADKVGEEVPYEVARDVYTPFPAHILLVPAGTPAFGKVTRSSRRGMLGKAGKLEFTCDYVRALDGTHISLRSEKTTASGRSNSGANVAAVLLFAPGYLLINGRDTTVDKGKEITAFVDQETLLTDPHDRPAQPQFAPVAGPTSPLSSQAISTQTLFTLKDGTQIVGSLVSFDGVSYLVATPSGSQIVSAANVASMHALTAGSPTHTEPNAAPASVALPRAAAPLAPTAAMPAATPIQAAPPAPHLPVIKTFPQRVRIETNDGNSYFGTVTAFDGAIYSVTTSSGILSVKKADVKALELL